MDIQKIKEKFLKHKILYSILLVIVLIIIVVVYSIFSSNSRMRGDYESSSFGNSFAPSLVDNYSYLEDSSLQKSKSYSGGGYDEGVSQNTASVLTERKVVNNGSLDIYVKNTEDAIDGIKKIASDFGGYIDRSNVNEISDDVKSGQITIRVPASKFEQTISEVKKLAEKVKSEAIETSDVTANYIDLSSNLINYKAEEKQYLEIMKRTGTIKEILEVQERLSVVRGNIERTQAQLNYLESQISMSTITIGVTSEPDVEVFGITWKPLTTIKLEFRNFIYDMKGIFEGFLVFLFALPGFLIKTAFVIAIIWVVVKVLKFIYFKFFRKKQVLPTEDKSSTT